MVLSQLVGLPTDHVISVVLGQDAAQVGIGSCAILGENIETNLVTFAWRLLLSMLRVSVRGLSCQILHGTDHVISVVVAAKMHVLVSMARALLLGRILWRSGYVRVAYGALNVEIQCSWAVVPDFAWH